MKEQEGRPLHKKLKLKKKKHRKTRRKMQHDCEIQQKKTKVGRRKKYIPTAMDYNKRKKIVRSRIIVSCSKKDMVFCELYVMS